MEFARLVHSNTLHCSKICFLGKIYISILVSVQFCWEINMLICSYIYCGFYFLETVNVQFSLMHVGYVH